MKQVSRTTRALRGLAAAVALMLVFVVALVASSGGFDNEPEATSTVTLTGSPLAVNAPVQYRGIPVGNLVSVTPIGGSRSTTAKITMRFEPARLGRIPASVQVRILPRTVFGDLYLDLVDNGSRAGGYITNGATITADNSKETVDLYNTYEKAYEVLSAIRPSQINQVLTAMSDTLSGRGAQIGNLIDRADTLTKNAMPIVNNIGPLMQSFAQLTGSLRTAAPDLFATLNNAVSLSQFVAKHQGDIATLLGGGIQGSDEVQQFFANNRQSLVTILHDGAPVMDTFANHPDGIPQILQTFSNLAVRTNGVDTHTTMNLKQLDLSGLAPYTSADCPRYSGLAGPNCSTPAPAPVQRQQAAPVQDSPDQQTTAMRKVLPRITGSTAAPPPPSSDGIIGLFLSPFLRGKTVLLP